MNIITSPNLISRALRKRNIWMVPALLAAGLLAIPEQLAAQEEGGALILEEVLVTSRRYEESITDAPLAVNVLDSEYLRDQGIGNLSDVIEMTPGATWAHFTMAQPGFTLRGMESYNVGNASLESAVQVVVDGIAVTKAFMMTPPVYDLERVEVMRGPQGTTFGRNATLGIAHFITKKPSQEFGAQIEATAGTRDLYGLTGYINGGLTDTISGRLAFHKKEYDGDLEDIDSGDALEGYDNTSIRGSLMIEPNDTFSAYVKAEYSEDDAQSPARGFESCTVPTLRSGTSTPPGPYINEFTDSCDPWTTSISTPPPGGFNEERDMLSLTAELAWKMDDKTITWLSGYQDGDHETVMDVFASPVVIQDQYVSNDADVISTELRIDNHASGNALTWLAGIYYMEDEETRVEANNGAPDRGNGAGRTRPLDSSWLIADGTSNTDSLGIFGEISYDIGESWNVTLGARYTDESKDYDFSNICWGRSGACSAVGLYPGEEYSYDEQYDCSQNIVDGKCGTRESPMGIGIPDALHVSESWDNFSPRFSVSYAVNDNNNIYALYSEGFKSGGFQHDARNARNFYEGIVDPETVENYEIGWKGAYDSFRFAVTAFYMEQQDAQNSVLLPIPGGSYATAIGNYGGIEMDGFEFEGTWLVSENFLLGGNFAFYDGKLGDESFTGARYNPDTGQLEGEDVSGLDTGLDETYVIYGEYGIDLSGGSRLAFRADLQHRSTVAPPALRAETRTLDGKDLAFERPEVDNVGFRATWTSANESIRISVWGQNILDEEDFGGFGPASSFHFNNGGSGPGTSPRNFMGRERYGADISYMWL